jgi:hypothetical protein
LGGLGRLVLRVSNWTRFTNKATTIETAAGIGTAGGSQT